MNGVDNYSMAGDKLFKKLKKTLKYFELISSSNYWKYMPGSGPRLVNIQKVLSFENNNTNDKRKALQKLAFNCF